MENKTFQIIVDEFLQGIDKYIRENINTLSCHDIWKIYYHLFFKLKEIKGTSSGFTGFSELLIFRFMFHLLNGFEVKKYTNDTRYFLNKPFTMYQSVRPLKTDMDIDISPDILITKANKPVAAIEIKLYLPGGKQTVTEAFNRLDRLQELNPSGFFGQLLIFTYKKPKRVNNKSIYAELVLLQERNPWFSFLILRNEKALLKDCLYNSLKLNRLQKDLYN
jgi:hypothetical protein